MAEASTDAFLQGQGIPVALREIEPTLDQLWGPAAEMVGGPDYEQPHLTRVVLANLVVEGLSGDADSMRPAVEAVITRYPCRVIVIRGSDDTERRIQAEVSAVCHLPAPGSPQVCSERIVLFAGSKATDLVAGAVRPLLEADLPMVLWWTTDPLENERLFLDLAQESTRLMLDLPDPETSAASLRKGLDPAVCACSRDAAWPALTRWRELVAQFYDPACHRETLPYIDSLKIEVHSPDPARPPRLALWMAAWLAGQLGWKAEGEVIREAKESGTQFATTFQGPKGPVAIKIITRRVESRADQPPALLSVSLSANGPEGAGTFRLRRPSPDSIDVVIEARAPGYCQLPSVVRSPEIDRAGQIFGSLDASRLDPPYEQARPIMLWLLEQSEAAGA